MVLVAEQLMEMVVELPSAQAVVLEVVLVMPVEVELQLVHLDLEVVEVVELAA
jgi:hypothetical protein